MLNRNRFDLVFSDSKSGFDCCWFKCKEVLLNPNNVCFSLGNGKDRLTDRYCLSAHNILLISEYSTVTGKVMGCVWQKQKNKNKKKESGKKPSSDANNSLIKTFTFASFSLAKNKWKHKGCKLQSLVPG